MDGGMFYYRHICGRIVGKWVSPVRWRYREEERQRSGFRNRWPSLGCPYTQLKHSPDGRTPLHKVITSHLWPLVNPTQSPAVEGPQRARNVSIGQLVSPTGHWSFSSLDETCPAMFSQPDLQQLEQALVAAANAGPLSAMQGSHIGWVQAIEEGVAYRSWYYRPSVVPTLYTVYRVGIWKHGENKVDGVSWLHCVWYTVSPWLVSLRYGVSIEGGALTPLWYNSSGIIILCAGYLRGVQLALLGLTWQWAGVGWEWGQVFMTLGVLHRQP